jgi:hypothetical protein
LTVFSGDRVGPPAQPIKAFRRNDHDDPNPPKLLFFFT